MDTLVSRAVLETGPYSPRLPGGARPDGLALSAARLCRPTRWSWIVVSAALLAGGFGVGLMLAVLTDDPRPQARGLVRITFLPAVPDVRRRFSGAHAAGGRSCRGCCGTRRCTRWSVSRGYYSTATSRWHSRRARPSSAAFALLTLSLGLSLYRVQAASGRSPCEAYAVIELRRVTKSYLDRPMGGALRLSRPRLPFPPKVQASWG
mgnify:CR=1 FL=1